jgi:integrase
MGLGSYPEISLALAREKAREARALLTQGVDPLDRRKVEWSRSVAQAAQPRTVRDLVEAYYQLNSAKWAAGTAYNFRRNMEKHALPILGEVMIPDIGNFLAHRVLDPIWMTVRGSARDLLTHLTAVFDYAEFKGLRQGNPFRNMRKHDLPPQPEFGHRRFMHHELVPDLMQKLRGFGGWPARYRTDIDRTAVIEDRKAGMNFSAIGKRHRIDPSHARWICAGDKVQLISFAMVTARALETLILTGPPRSGEIRYAQWREIDWDQKLLIMPRSRMKVRKGRGDVPYVAPLVPRVIEILREMEAVRCNDYIFPGSPTGRGARARERLAAKHPGVEGFPLSHSAMSQFLRNTLGYADIDVHGFRSSFVGWAMASGFPDTVIKLSIDHAIGDQVTRAYFRNPLIEERREMLEAWASYCAGSGADVIRLPRERRPIGTKTAVG